LVSYPSMGKQERPEKFPNSVKPSESHISWRLLYGCCTDNCNATANCLKPLVAPLEIEWGAKILIALKRLANSNSLSLLNGLRLL
jgi:hypothetical protein